MKSFCIATLFCGGVLASTVLADVTGITGSSPPAPVPTIQPSLGLNYLIRTQGIFPSQNGSPVGTIGEITMFAGNFAPDGYAMANGQLLPISQNTALFSLLGTTWGGDGKVTFGLPNLQGRTPIGTGQGPGLSNRVLGEMTGVENVTLSEANLAPHAHTIPGGGSTSLAGASTPYTTMQPSAAINYYVATEGIFPSQGGGGFSGTDPVLAFVYSTAYNFNFNQAASASGQILSIAQNTAVFSLMGTTYGGNGVNTFALPDLRGRAPIGVGQGPGLSNQDLGQVQGTEDTTMLVNQMPAHDHTLAGGGVTGVTGSNQPQSTMQPTLALHPIIAIQGIFPPRGGGGGVPDEPYLGQIDLFAGNFAPSGWAFANGQILSIAQNTALFSLLGTTYGGNGVTTFALPNLQGRIGVDDGIGAGLSPVSLGQSYGSETVTLNITQLPAHDHDYTPVPEPTTLVSMMLCASGIFFRRRR